MKLLITGGAGFIGSNFVRYMLNNHPSYKLVNLDVLSYAGNLQNLIDVEMNPNYRFVKSDITDANAIQHVFSEGWGGTAFDAVVNFAAESHVDRSIADPQTFTRTNMLGTHVLLDEARRAQVTKFVQVSTDEVYGTLGERGYFTEASPILPNSPYSASKSGADCLVRAYHKTYGLNVNITRCSNNYGPYQFPEKLIPLMVIRAIQGESLPVYGDGLNVRDWLHVEDHCRAIDLVLHGGRAGDVYNVGGQNEQTNIDIVRAILRELGSSSSQIQFVEDRLGHDRRYAIDATKIHTELGWEPRRHFDEGLIETINWYANHVDWWRQVLSGEYRLYYGRHYEESSSI